MTPDESCLQPPPRSGIGRIEQETFVEQTLWRRPTRGILWEIVVNSQETRETSRGDLPQMLEIFPNKPLISLGSSKLYWFTRSTHMFYAQNIHPMPFPSPFSRLTLISHHLYSWISFAFPTHPTRVEKHFLWPLLPSLQAIASIGLVNGTTTMISYQANDLLESWNSSDPKLDVPFKSLEFRSWTISSKIHKICRYLTKAFSFGSWLMLIPPW